MKILSILFFSTLLSINSCNKQKSAVQETDKQHATNTLPTIALQQTNNQKATEKMEEKTETPTQEPDQLKGITIGYEAITRGFQLFTTIQNGKFMVKHGASNEAEEVKISAENWIKISNLYTKIDLLDLEKLVGATQERMHDGKAHGNLSITKKDKIYTTKGFDHGVPPAKIKAFVDFIVALSAKKE